MIPTLAELRTALDEGRATSLKLTDAALAHIADPAGEGVRVYTKVYSGAGARRRPGVGPAARRRPGALRRSTACRSRSRTCSTSPAKPRWPARWCWTTRRRPAKTRRSSQRLQAAGAVIVGRTNMTEFAYSGLGLNPHYGTPRNPWDRATGRIPGGSSSGAAVSVTDGMAAAAIGTDTGGSVRIPAALCGLTGFKPTARRVPLRRRAAAGGPARLDRPIAASVACCAQLDAILAGETQPLPAPARLRGMRLALPTTMVQRRHGRAGSERIRSGAVAAVGGGRADRGNRRAGVCRAGRDQCHRRPERRRSLGLAPRS